MSKLWLGNGFILTKRTLYEQKQCFLVYSNVLKLFIPDPYKKRQPPRRRLTREERALARQAKYRYLYQIRTAGGDILSQSYIQSIQKKSQLDTLSTHMSTLPTTNEESRSDE